LTALEEEKKDATFLRIRRLVDEYNRVSDEDDPDVVQLLQTLDSVDETIFLWSSSRESVDTISGLSSDDLRKSKIVDKLEKEVDDERRSLVTNPFFTEFAETLAGPEAEIRPGKTWFIDKAGDGNWIDASSLLTKPLDATITGAQGGDWIFTVKIGKDYKGKAKKDQVTLKTRFQDVSEDPLYPSGVPTPGDVLQSNLGDCYLQAALASLAAQDPAYIVGKMVYDAGDKVVVRLYKLPEYTPKFIVVDKSIPETTDGVELYNRGALWVRMVQKAYAASGLGKGLMQQQTLSYKDIAGHLPAYAMGVLLGREIETSAASGEAEQETDLEQAKLPWSDEVQTYAIYREEERTPSWINPSAQDRAYNAALALLQGIFGDVPVDIDEWAAFADANYNELGRPQSLSEMQALFDEKGLDERLATPVLLWMKNSRLFRGDVGSGHYSKGQERLAQKIAEALFAHRVVVTGTKNQAPAQGGGVGGSGEPKYRGLAFKHAYSVLDLRRKVSANPESPEKGPHTFLKIRNPWGSYERVYQVDEEDWTSKAAEEDDDRGGTFWIELNDFSTNFGDVAFG
jgi:hypothetical protein